MNAQHSGAAPVAFGPDPGPTTPATDCTLVIPATPDTPSSVQPALSAPAPAGLPPSAQQPTLLPPGIKGLPWRLLSTDVPASLNALFARVLLNRGITDDTARKSFLGRMGPLYSVAAGTTVTAAAAGIAGAAGMAGAAVATTAAGTHPDYAPLTDIRPAVEAIISELIHPADGDTPNFGIFGDYDADGTTAAALLIRSLRRLGAQTAFYIPPRSIGYGLNREGLQRFADAGIRTVIAVDCGAAGEGAITAADFAKELGITLVVTDHHQVGEILPDAVAVVNPQRRDCRYPNKALAGVGVAYRVMEAVCAELADRYGEYELLPSGEGDGTCRETVGVTVPSLRELDDLVLDLVAIGTIADVMMLVGENRVLVHQGLQRINAAAAPGVKALIAAVRPAAAGQVKAEDVAFYLGPAINAVGRMDTADRAVQLLAAEKDPGDGSLERIASELVDLNRQRRQTTEEAGRLALERIREEGRDEDPVLVVHLPEVKDGIVGLVASRLKERYGRPAIVLTDHPSNPDLLKGSGRSVPGFHLHAAMCACAELFAGFGGHAMAAGLTMPRGNVDALRERLGEAFLQAEVPTEVLDVDCEIPGRALRVEVVQRLSSLEPFGAGNSEPLFLVRNVRVESWRALKERHLKIFGVADGGAGETGNSLKKGNSPADRVTVIGFGLAGGYVDSGCPPLVDLVGRPKINEWNGQVRVDFHLVDWRAAIGVEGA